MDRPERTMGDETDSLTAGAAWLQILLNRPEKEIIKMIQQNPQLVSQKISLTCLSPLNVNESPECNCSRHLETLQGQGSQKTEELLAEFHMSILLGVCPHVLSILHNYDETSSGSTANNPQIRENIHELISRLYKKHKPSAEVNMNQNLTDPSECSVRSFMLKSLVPYSCTASISAIHIVTALGKHQLLRKILSDRVTPVGSLCFHFESGYHSASPFHIAVFHRQYKAIDILGKKIPQMHMACNMDQNFGGGNITPSILAAQMSDLSALQHLLKYRTPKHSLNSETLLASLENRSMDCAEFLAKKKHACLSRSFLSQEVACIFDLQESDQTLKLLKELIMNPAEKNFLKLLIDYSCFPIDRIISFSVHLEAIETTEYLLQSTKAASLTRSPLGFMRLLTMATLQNSPGLLSVLVRYVGPKRLPLYTLDSSLYWAKVLQYDKCENILAKLLLINKGNFETDITSKPPFPAIFHESMEVVQTDLLGTVRRLNDIGYDINATTGKGESCLNAASSETYLAASVKKYGPLVSLLLELGADVFATGMYNVPDQVMHPPMLLRLLWANVDICGPPRHTGGTVSGPQSYTPPIIMPMVKSPMQLLILRTAHTICKDNIDFLRSKLGNYDEGSTTNGDLSDHLKEYIDSPQPLLRLCRNSIRRSAGIRLHKFMEGNECSLPI
ncbi:uncharacterized protein LOC117327209 isoform X2 [Pecten maximus]|uniref:uncharacterized protein LOC117327209 isoform X2 n=1 Tax=Pecten maximus TaxID=6579 RepID=UPI00145892DD|nr:uncharacterized protein LOC117327209 isoform X2 [Pecten maximus]